MAIHLFYEEVFAHLVVAAVFKTVGPHVNRVVGGFDSHTLPPFFTALSSRNVASTQPNPEQRSETSRRKSITESPWYWVYLFSTAVLIAIVLLGPKIIERQTIDERNYQARQRTYQQASGEQPDIPLSTSNNQLITLQPLIITFAIVLTVSWIILWYRHFYRGAQKLLAKDIEDPVVQGSQ